MDSGYQDLQIDLARRLRAARTLSGKKVPELARDLGWSKEKIYRLEQGRQTPDALELAEIAGATGQPIDFFYERTTSSQSPEATTGPRTKGASQEVTA